MTERAFARALEHLYNAALDPQAWVSFMDEFSRLIEARGAHYFLWNQQLQDITYALPSSNFSMEIQVESAEYWHSKDRMFKYSLKHASKWLVNTRVFDRQYLASDPFHNEFLFPNDIYHVTGYRTRSTTPLSSAIGFIRGGDQPPMGEDELAWLKRLEPHLEIAGRLHREMMRLKLSADLQAQTLDALDCPILLVYENGFMAFHNRAADQWLADNSAMGVRSFRLAGLNVQYQASLEQLLDRVFKQGVSGIQALPRPDGGSPYQMMALPLSPSSPLCLHWQRPVALLVVSDPQARAPLTSEQLQTLFGLTPAEARVAIALAEGKALDEVAEDSQVSINTVRYQLKRTLEKTGTRRQAELVKTINAMPNVNLDKAGKEDGK